MAKNNQPQTGDEQKVQTKYERKMEQRKKQAEKDKRDEKVMRISATVMGLLLVVIIAGSVIFSVMNKKAAVEDAYITVGNHEITKVEYDFYYNATLSQYANMLAYMGMDAGGDLESQQFSEDLTWKDFIDQSAVEQIRQTKALADDAQAKGFTYDVTEEYNNTVTALQTGAETAGVTLKDYYELTYGEYATEKNMESFIKEGLLTNAYYDHLKEQNTPTEQEVKDYYAANTQSYDKVDYRSFMMEADVATDASLEEIDQAMVDAKAKADAMVEALEGGADFRELCIENASEEEKATYEDAENDASLYEGSYYSGMSTIVGDWLYEEGRVAGDRVVLEDLENYRYYVVEFINRYYDEADDANISDTIASQRASDIVAGLKENYEVVDNKGVLKYLTVEAAAETTEESATETTEATE